MENQFSQQLFTVVTNFSNYENLEDIWVKNLVLNCTIISIVVLLAQAVSYVFFGKCKFSMFSAGYSKIRNKSIPSTKEKENDKSIMGFIFVLSLTNLAVLYSLIITKPDKFGSLKHVFAIILAIQIFLGAIDLYKNTEKDYILKTKFESIINSLNLMKVSTVLCIFTSIPLLPLINFGLYISQTLSENYGWFQILLLGVKFCLYTVLIFVLSSVLNILLAFLLLLITLFLIGIIIIIYKYPKLDSGSVEQTPKFDLCSVTQYFKLNLHGNKQDTESFPPSVEQEL